jgi:hypothetical protein
MDHGPADAGVRLPTPVLGPAFALGPGHVVACAVFGAMLVGLNLLTLWYTDLWSHVAYGRWILEHGRLPTREPFLPLAAGVRIIPYCWLSQVIFALVERLGGAAGLSGLFAVIVLARYLVLARVCVVQTGRLGLGLTAMLAGFAMNWARNPILRPEVFAALCFQLLLGILASVDPGARVESGGAAGIRWGRRAWVGIPLLFAAWVNLHSSIVVGLIVLAAHAAGRAVEVAWDGRRLAPGRVVRDPGVRRWVALTALAAAACLLNPDGGEGVWFSWAIARHPNLRDVSEWQPLAPTSLAGRTVAASWVLLVVVLRRSRRPVRPVEALLLAIFGLGVYQTGRMILWYVPVYLYALLPHAAEIVARVRPPDPAAAPPWRSFRFTWACLAIVWASFALSHLSDRLLGAAPRAPEALYHPRTPRGLAAYLIAHPPTGQVWNSQVLGDWLLWAWMTEAGPAAPPLKLFVDSHMHVVPRRVWLDHQAVGFVHPGWREVLEKYRVTTLVVSTLQHPELARAIRRTPGWTVRYEDGNGLIATRDGDPGHG